MLTQQQHKDLQQAQSMLAHPQVDPQEKVLAAAIVKRLTELGNQPEQPRAKPATSPRAAHTQPAPARTATKFTLHTSPAPPPPPPLKVATAAPHRYQASHTSVTIHWPSGEQTYRYYQVRSRLYVSLKNLVHSTANNQVTYKEIQHYAAWSNAQTYYAALTAIWGHPPTFEQLDFSPSTLDLQALEEMFHQVVKDIAP